MPKMSRIDNADLYATGANRTPTTTQPYGPTLVPAAALRADILHSAEWRGPLGILLREWFATSEYFLLTSR